jgi:hypothetical protein
MPRMKIDIDMLTHATISEVERGDDDSYVLRFTNGNALYVDAPTAYANVDTSTALAAVEQPKDDYTAGLEYQTILRESAESSAAQDERDIQDVLIRTADRQLAHARHMRAIERAEDRVSMGHLAGNISERVQAQFDLMDTCLGQERR